MLGKRKTPVIKDNEILENIKKEIETKLTKMGVVTSKIDMEMNSENISLSILVRRLPPLTPHI
jgi:tRNA threonylcarbamoyladenosine modification (KEOPS) complex  Pcc1 subunit